MSCPLGYSNEDEFSYENVLKKNRGLLNIKVKVEVRDTEALSVVYTPGVAQPCLEIQKDLSRAYEMTNKGNSILVVTDCSGKHLPEEAHMNYLEAFSVMYKMLSNVDAYPIILDAALIKDAETLFEVINAISLSYSGIEFYMIDCERFKKFQELYEKANSNQYALICGCHKRKLDELLKEKNIKCSSHAIYAMIWRVALDTRCYKNLEPVLEHVTNCIKDGKIDATKGPDCVMAQVLGIAVDFIFEKKMENRTLDKYNWLHLPMSKEFVFKKFKAFLNYGSGAWFDPMPEGYYMKQHNHSENSNMLHQRAKGVIEVYPKIKINSHCRLAKFFSWENLDAVSEKIAKNPDLVYELTCKSNYGSIITNGTAILGLGNIGALAGMPVMEGKSVLFKHYGGTNIAPLCIQELNNEKLVFYTRCVAPSFIIINLEDIKGPDCFFIETELIKTVKSCMFHDDQHGTAVVVLAGLLNATKLRGSKPEEMKIVMNGAGAAGISVCQLLLHAGFKNFIVCDTAGAIYKGRPNNMNPFKEKIAELTNRDCVKGKLCDVIKGADVVIGLSGPNTIKKEDVKLMAEKPIVFALANPTPEIFPNDAYEAGAYIVATGRSDYPNQINNSIAFPGIFRGAVDTRSQYITLEMKVAAAHAVANLVSEKELSPMKIMPSALEVRNGVKVAVDVAKVAVEKNLCKVPNLNFDKFEENIHSYFIEGSLMGINY
jgi:malic enzyme